jgi:cathepsin B
MKTFNITVLVVLALAAYSALHFTKAEETYQQRIANIAAEINAMNTTWRAHEPSRFLNMQKSEIKALMGSLPEDQSKRATDVSNYFQMENVSAPDSFDARDTWPGCQSIKEIRDQANCGSCWAFAAAESMSDRWCIAYQQKSQVRISTQDITSCCHTCGNGCNGGNAGPAWNSFVREGFVTGDLYGDNTMCKPYLLAPCAHHTTSTKYPACSGDSKTPSCERKCNSAYPTAYKNDIKKGHNHYSLRGAGNFATEISTRGPIAVAFSVYEDFLTYKSGVYKHKTGSYLGGHAVRAIGYGTDATDGPYWIIVNSWNETWGDNGTFKIARGKNECGIESSGDAGTVKAQ